MLHIVIVNYNVKHYLRQCLQSVFASDYPADMLDVWVVDNNSTDGSVEMLRQSFPQVHLIANNDNPGFAFANNQAIRQISKSSSTIDRGQEYLLLLNPDTLVQADTLSTSTTFLSTHPEAGALCVKMLNAQGQFLRESKRGFPSPATSFFKISGLIRLFPHHPTIAAYYMGHLSDDAVNPIDILPGAYIMTRLSVIDQVGLLDEEYFMFGEDIDFSWRIRLAGYKNYYLPTTRILHYKGESTSHASLNYVYSFYNAMAIFTRHYFSTSRAKLFNTLIHTAIWLRATLSFLQRIARALLLPLLDFAASLTGFFLIKNIWATLWATNVHYYAPQYTLVVLPLYVLILLTTMFLAGGYDRPLRLPNLLRGLLSGTALLLIFYSLIPESLRYSRAIILFGSLWTIFSTLSIRLILNLIGFQQYGLLPPKKRKYLIIANPPEQQRIASIMAQSGVLASSVHVVQPAQFDFATPALPHPIDELIFSLTDVPVASLLDTSSVLSSSHLSFRTAPSGSDVILGSNYTRSPEQLFSSSITAIDTKTNRRSKRLFDIVTSTILIVLSPILFPFQQSKGTFYPHLFTVLIGRRTWVSYTCHLQPSSATTSLPRLRPGVLCPSDRYPWAQCPEVDSLNAAYADKYSVLTDLSILTLNLFRL